VLGEFAQPGEVHIHGPFASRKGVIAEQHGDIGAAKPQSRTHEAVDHARGGMGANARCPEHFDSGGGAHVRIEERLAPFDDLLPGRLRDCLLDHAPLEVAELVLDGFERRIHVLEL